MFRSLLSAATLVATASAAFDPLSKNNVITYWGQGADQARLVETCKNSAYDIINVGFVNVFPDQDESGWPGTNFGNACWGDVYQNAQGQNTSLLKTCPYIGEDVIACQQTYGKKIFLSLGGASHLDYYIESAASARKFANFLWAAFGPASATTSDVPRPWGDAGVDGFDFDIESYMNPPPVGRPNYQRAFYVEMITRFKNGLFPTDTSKSYYISGAPQCTIPDDHFTEVVAKAWFDFLFIQFYNTPGCSARDGVKAINGKGTADISYLQWVASKSLNPNIRMSIGLPAAKKASSLASYFLTPTEAQKLVKKFYKQKLFGGVMLWEATFASKTKPCATDYGTWMKNILNGQAAGKDIKTTCPAKRDLSEYEEESASTSTRCTSTVTLTRSRSSSAPFTDVPSYGNTESASSPAAPVTTSAPVYSASEGYSAPASSDEVASESAPFGLCTKTTTLIFRSGSETSTIVEPCASTCTAKTSSSYSSVPASTSSAAVPSSPAEYSSPAPSSSSANSYPASPEETSSAASYPASPESSSAAPGTCGEVTVTVKEQSTVYVTATEGASSGDVTSQTTIQSTSTIYDTQTAYLTRYPTASAPAGSAGYGSAAGSPSSPASPASSPPSGYENGPVGGAGSSSPAPAASAYTPHGHNHGQAYSHSHGGEQGPQSTTTVINVVTVFPVPVTSGGAVQPTGAPYPYGAGARGNGTASASGSAWPTYAGPQQTGGAVGLGCNGMLVTAVSVLAALMLML